MESRNNDFDGVLKYIWTELTEKCLEFDKKNVKSTAFNVNKLFFGLKRDFYKKTNAEFKRIKKNMIENIKKGE